MHTSGVRGCRAGMGTWASDPCVESSPSLSPCTAPDWSGKERLAWVGLERL